MYYVVKTIIHCVYGYTTITTHAYFYRVSLVNDVILQRATPTAMLANEGSKTKQRDDARQTVHIILNNETIRKIVMSSVV